MLGTRPARELRQPILRTPTTACFKLMWFAPLKKGQIRTASAAVIDRDHAAASAEQFATIRLITAGREPSVTFRIHSPSMRCGGATGGLRPLGAHLHRSA